MRSATAVLGRGRPQRTGHHPDSKSTNSRRTGRRVHRDVLKAAVIHVLDRRAAVAIPAAQLAVPPRSRGSQERTADQREDRDHAAYPSHIQIAPARFKTV